MSTAQHTPGPWMVATSNSWRRIVTAHRMESVCEPIKQSDGHPDLYFRNGGPDGPDARLMVAAPEVLSELQKAHELIVLMLNELTPAAKSRFMAKADRAGLIVEGATRYHERAAVIAKATGSAG